MALPDVRFARNMAAKRPGKPDPSPGGRVRKTRAKGPEKPAKASRKPGPHPLNHLKNPHHRGPGLRRAGGAGRPPPARRG
ncbi:hypothetical protein GCM10023334_086160 [Nonomuraea thailandensis]